ncbi:MAG TPA: DUF2249 domain-containing protein [Longimicrobiales bacterium]|nr:DUF2249 domain-containing protein [Longimicrobiales bacterium]
MVIQASDRVSAVLERDERLVDVFVAASPTFERLRSKTMRKVMARLVTVEQAARMAGLDPADLVARLQAALDEDAGAAAPPPSDGAPAAPGHQHFPRTEPQVRAENEPSPPPAGGRQQDPPTAQESAGDVPAHLAALPPALVVDLDVRPELRRGEEPFSKIMAARRSLPEGGVLRLRATFEPVPLYAVLGKQGLGHWTERFADDDWRVWFYPEESAGRADAAPAVRAAGPPAGSAPQGAPAASAGAPDAPRPAPEDDVVVLDVRGLEPPEPMQRTLEALATLPPGKTLVQINVREPRFLLPLLTERGWTYEVRPQGDELVRTFIRRSAEP